MHPTQNRVSTADAPITADVTRTCQPDVTPFTSAALVAALEQAWTAIRTRHPEVPAAVIVVGSGSPSKPSQALKFGHFQTLTWQSGADRLPEVLVSGEGLSRTPGEVFTTLLHEATHGLASVRGIQDTSRQGRWHNQQFAKLAAELGMTTVKDDKLGFSPCTLTDETAGYYRSSLDVLATALSAYRHLDMHAEGKAKPSNNGVTAECACPRKIRVAASVLDLGAIRCDVCDEAFLTEDTDRDDYNTTHSTPVDLDAEDNTDDRNNEDDLDDEDEDQAEQDDDRDDDSEEDDEMVFYDPTGARFGGMPTYPFKAAPQGLATVRQLRAIGLRPNGQTPVAQMLWRRGERVAYLYRIDGAAPKRTASPAQREAIDRALVARRTCPTCEQVKDYYIPRRLGECLDCAPGGTK